LAKKERHKVDVPFTFFVYMGKLPSLNPSILFKSFE